MRTASKQLTNVANRFLILSKIQLQKPNLFEFTFHASLCEDLFLQGCNDCPNKGQKAPFQEILFEKVSGVTNYKHCITRLFRVTLFRAELNIQLICWDPEIEQPNVRSPDGYQIHNSSDVNPINHRSSNKHPKKECKRLLMGTGCDEIYDWNFPGLHALLQGFFWFGCLCLDVQDERV